MAMGDDPHRGGGCQRDNPLAVHRARMAGAHGVGPVMPRDGAIFFGDLVGKLDALRVGCAKAGGRASIGSR